MTVYHCGMEVEVIAGDTKEGWAAIRFKGNGTETDTNLTALSADGGWGEIEDEIEKGNAALDFNPTQYRVRVRYPKEWVIVETHNGHTLFRADFLEEMEEHDDFSFVTDVVMPAIRIVDWAHRQPNRLLYRNRDKIEGVEA